MSVRKTIAFLGGWLLCMVCAMPVRAADIEGVRVEDVQGLVRERVNVPGHDPLHEQRIRIEREHAAQHVERERRREDERHEGVARADEPEALARGHWPMASASRPRLTAYELAQL